MELKSTVDRLIYDLMYRMGKPVWDTGTVPPEVVEAVAKERTPGRALDLGCGTGTHSIYLAQHGWDVIGIDFSTRAIASAGEQARQANVKVDFRIADVSRLELSGKSDFALDVGCFHGLDDAERERYVEQLARLMHSGGRFMLWALDRPARFENYSVAPQVVEKLFAPQFALSRSEHGDHRGRPTTWYWFTRK